MVAAAKRDYKRASTTPPLAPAEGPITIRDFAEFGQLLGRVALNGAGGIREALSLIIWLVPSLNHFLANRSRTIARHPAATSGFSFTKSSHTCFSMTPFVSDQVFNTLYQFYSSRRSKPCTTPALNIRSFCQTHSQVLPSSSSWRVRRNLI